MMKRSNYFAIFTGIILGTTIVIIMSPFVFFTDRTLEYHFFGGWIAVLITYEFTGAIMIFLTYKLVRYTAKLERKEENVSK